MCMMIPSFVNIQKYSRTCDFKSNDAHLVIGVWLRNIGFALENWAWLIYVFPALCLLFFLSLAAAPECCNTQAMDFIAVFVDGRF